MLRHHARPHCRAGSPAITRVFPLPTTTATLPAGQSRGRLLRILGIGFGLAVGVGETIAAGIVRTPGEIASRLPATWLFLGVWVLGGIYAMLGALQLSELGAMIPQSGGQYNFARRALGDYAGFIVGWSDWISTCGTTSAVAIVIGEYLGVLVPRLAGREVVIALAVTAAFTLLQWRGLRWGSRTQEITGVLKASGFLAIVAACFLLGGKSQASGTAVVSLPTGLPLVAALVVGLQAVIYSYDGWDSVIYFCEEVRNPGRDIPRSMFGGVLSIMGIYLLLNLALVYLLPISQIAGQNFALGVAAQKIFGAHGDQIVRAVMVLSLLSCVNANEMLATRVPFAMSRDGLFSRRAMRVNEGGTPSVALFASSTVAALLILSGTFEKVIALLAFFFVANYAISFLSVFVLRRREPDALRPYRAWGYPWTTGLALLGSLAFLAGAVAGDTRNSLWAGVLLAASYPVYRLLRRAIR
jgi:basic amino acid/polyamine antiporter, APA family